MAETPSATPTFAADHAPTPSAVGSSSRLPAASPERYHDRESLGRGGMGEVRRCADMLVGRDVAFKCMHAGAGAGRERFLDEARMQARLEHPSIVPVYDMGTDADGSPWFTMRRIDGVTLEHVLAELAAEQADARERFGRRRLLGDFVRVCQAVAYAHRQGVVHRDIKPSNIILTDDGGVYLLDWGIATSLGASVPEPLEPLEPSRSTPATRSDLRPIVGTLGYMPPELLTAPDATPDGRADVYALGATLYEILTLAPLHRRESPAQLVAATLEGVDARASLRALGAEVPPELEAVCRRATATAATDRYADVPEMIAEIEAYLDGDRDLSARRALAQEHATRAERGLAAGSDLESRAAAMREAGRALALDPECTAALRVITQLMLEPPREIPREVARQLRRTDAHNARALARLGLLARMAMLALLVPLLAMGVRSWPLLVGLAVLTVVSAIDAIRGIRASDGRGVPLQVQLGNALLLGALATVTGPFIAVPVLATASTAMFVLAGTRNLRLVLWLGGAPILVPFVLDQLSLIPSTMVASGDALTILPWMVSFPPGPTYAFIMLATLTGMVVAVRSMANVRDRLAEARREQLMQAWHLRQLVPS